MLTLAQVRDWLKTLGTGEHFYIGKLDNKKEKSIGVYSRDGNTPVMAIGGIKNKKYEVKSVSVLVHWNKNAAETEQAALELYDRLLNLSNLVIDQTHVNYLRLMVAEPQDVGTDDNGVYERAIWFDLYYERKDE